MNVVKCFILAVVFAGTTAVVASDFDDLNGFIDRYSPRIVKLGIYCGLVYGGYRLFCYAKNELKKY